MTPLNFRDLGGLRTLDGGRVRSGVLHRSASPVFLDETGAAGFLAATGVRTRIDLRGRREVAETAARDRLAENVRVVHLPFGRSVLRPDHPDLSVRLAEHYADMLVVSAPAVTAAVRLATEARERPLLVHCTAGKDRTGVVVAVLLAAVSVQPTEIVEDYARSREHVTAIRDQTRALPAWAERLAKLPEEAHTAEPATMRHFLTLLQNRHGGAGAWLTAQGFDDSDHRSLRESLIEP